MNQKQSVKGSAQVSTQQSNFNDHAKRPEIKKSLIGADLVDNYLQKRGMISFIPSGAVIASYEEAFKSVDANQSVFPFDRIYSDHNFQQLFIVDVRVKAARHYYPDTGINHSVMDVFDQMFKRHRMKTFLSFVDEEREEIYGNWISELMIRKTVNLDGRELEYPKIEHTSAKGFSEKIIYFPLSSMSHIAMLTKEHVADLKALTNRNPKYMDGRASAEAKLIN